MALLGPGCFGAADEPDESSAQAPTIGTQSSAEAVKTDETGEEVSGERERTGEVAQADTVINCTGKNNVDCMMMCAEAGATCRPARLHPYRTEAGIGNLVACKTGTPTHTCSYRYGNGDKCTVVMPLGVPFLCDYGGGWIP